MLFLICITNRWIWDVLRISVFIFSSKDYSNICEIESSLNIIAKKEGIYIALFLKLIYQDFNLNKPINITVQLSK